MGWWNSSIRAALCRRDQCDEGGGTAVYMLHYIGGTRVMGWWNSSIRAALYKRDQGEGVWNSCIRAALYKRDQGDGVMEQLYTCCIK